VADADIEVVRAGFAALSEDGVEGLIRFIHPQFETTTTPQFSAEPDTYRGHDGIRRYFDSFYDAMDEIRFEPGEFRDAGGRVIVPVTLTARGRTTRIEVKQEVVMAWTVRDGQAVGLELFATLDEALDAVGDRA
jgi:ketosteroid isomerase-like protein